MGELTLVLGGARSGKSAFAQRLAEGYGLRVLYLATAQARDEEMAQRIREHQARRPASWRTAEEPLALAQALRQDGEGVDAFLVDSLTLWVSNLLLRSSASLEDMAARNAVRKAVEEATDDLLAQLGGMRAPVILVSDEVGQGLVPDNAAGRLFRDLLGKVNQAIAARADKVYYLVAGMPLELKGLARSL